MTVIAVASVAGSPGVTTLSLALAATWPDARAVIVMELDVSGGDLAGCWRLAPDPGLASLATEIRRDRDPGVLERHTQELFRGVRVITAPPSPGRAGAALSALVEPLPQMLKKLPRDTVVIADLGRLNSMTSEIASLADRLLVLARPRLTDLAHLEGLAQTAPRAEVVLVGHGPYPEHEVTEALDLRVLARVGHDPLAQAFMEGRRTRTRLVKSVQRLSEALSTSTRMGYIR